MWSAFIVARRGLLNLPDRFLQRRRLRLDRRATNPREQAAVQVVQLSEVAHAREPIRRCKPGRGAGPGSWHEAGGTVRGSLASVPLPGADRAWWSDWSSKPARLRKGLGRFDSYTLPPGAS